MRGRFFLSMLLYLALNIYAGARALALIRFFAPSFSGFVFWPVFLIFGYSLILTFMFPILEKIPAFRFTAVYALPIVIYFCLGLFVLDAARLALGFFGGAISSADGFIAGGAALAIFFTAVTLVVGSIHARNIKTAHYTITVNKQAGGGAGSGRESPLRIALISDIHIDENTQASRLAKMVDAVNQNRPDVIFLAGDIFDDDIANMPNKEEVAAELRRLSAPLGAYAVAGNHDVDTYYAKDGSRTALIGELMEKCGLIFLQDEARQVGGLFYLAGRRDASPIGGGPVRKTAIELTDCVDKSWPLFFLDHQPEDFAQMEKAGADLIFCGHTHRGQFFPGNILTAYIFKRSGSTNYGLWKGQIAQAVVTSGIGVWGPLFRVGTDSEVAVVDVLFRCLPKPLHTESPV